MAPTRLYLQEVLKVKGNLDEYEPNLKSTRRILCESIFNALQMENFYNSTRFRKVSRVKLAVYPVYFTGNTADCNMVHRPPGKKSNPAVWSNMGSYLTVDYTRPDYNSQYLFMSIQTILPHALIIKNIPPYKFIHFLPTCSGCLKLKFETKTLSILCKI